VVRIINKNVLLVREAVEAHTAPEAQEKSP